MKLSNGTDITYGADHLGPAIILDGDLASNTLTGSPLWTQQQIGGGDSRHCWRLPKTSELVRTTNNCPIEYLQLTKTILNTITTTTTHPALTNGFAAEAQRLFPGISASSNAAFASFIALLKTEYGIDEAAERSKKTTNFVDDIGPAILTIVDGAPSVLPEIPAVYKAPEDWVLLMWHVNNHMTGPLLDSDLADDQKIRFEGLTLDSKALRPEQRGLYYFHMTRFILIFESWIGNSDAPHLMEFIRLITKGVDPF